MLKPRFSVARPLALCVWLGSIASLALGSCQGPDTFLRTGATGGTGGGGKGSGGSSSGFGGFLGSGGFIGSGGAFGAGGSSFGSGGSSAGGATGTAGTTGSGGARDSGADSTGTGGAMVDANPDLVSNGMGPCMGICSPATEFASAPNYNSPNFLATVGICYETTSSIQGGGCSNCGGRTISINGSTPTGTWPSPLPAPVRGGYCVQVSAGLPDGGAVDYASFYTFH